MKWIKPWMVALTLTVVTAGGATAVFFVAHAQHESDRKDITRWLDTRYPTARHAVRLLVAQDLLLEDSARRVRRIASASLASIKGDRMTLLEGPLPEILQPVTARYVDAITLAVEAFDAARAAAIDGKLEPIESRDYRTLWIRASKSFDVADDAVRELLCRARLPSCPG
jgi:hypothetical protein